MLVSPSRLVELEERIAALQAENAAQRDEIERLRDALKKHATMPEVEGWCPICEGFGWLEGHKDGCVVGDIMKAGDK